MGRVKNKVRIIEAKLWFIESNKKSWWFYEWNEQEISLNKADWEERRRYIKIETKEKRNHSKFGTSKNEKR